MPYCGYVTKSVAGSEVGFVLVEGYIEHPVGRVLDVPVGATSCTLFGGGHAW